jgi:hypothetical protein
MDEVFLTFFLKRPSKFSNGLYGALKYSKVVVLSKGIIEVINGIIIYFCNLQGPIQSFP